MLTNLFVKKLWVFGEQIKHFKLKSFLIIAEFLFSNISDRDRKTKSVVIDSDIVSDQENAKKKEHHTKKGQTLGGFLSILDWIAELQGYIVVSKPNKAQLIVAVIFRAGRIDVRITKCNMKVVDVQHMLDCNFVTGLTSDQIDSLQSIKL